MTQLVPTVVVAGILERGGRMLICRRRPDQPHPLKWEFPGGKVEPGESPPDALRRELREELAIQATAAQEIDRYEFRYPGGKPILLIFYRVCEFAGEPENLVFDQIVWAAAGELPRYDFLEGDVDFVRRLATSAA